MHLRPLRSRTSPGAILCPAMLRSFSGSFAARTGRSRLRLIKVTTAAALFWLACLPVAPPTCSANAAQRKRARQHVIRREIVSAQTPSQEPAPAATAPASPTTPASQADDNTAAGQKVKLYYLREATKIVAVLNAIAKLEGSELNGLVITNATEDEIILYGLKNKRNQARRIIATLDLPRPGIEMEMWGIQISSRKPEKMADVMPEVREEINRTQQAVRETYNRMQQLARDVIPNEQLDTEFSKVLVDKLYYRSALDPNRPLSLADILLRMVAAKEPAKVAQEMAAKLSEAMRSPAYHVYAEALNREGKQPFERFFGTRGLSYRNGQWVENENSVTKNAIMGRAALLEFALHYGRLVHQPQSFNAYSLQQSAEALNSRLQAATDALNLDMQDLFVAPTLVRIREIVRRFKEVEYAQVGKVSVASLSGVPTAVTSHSVNAFDVTPPLRLSELLDKADKLSKSTGPFVPKPADNVVGAMPLSQVIGLIGAFGEERSVWRELQSGVSLTITPNVLRNMTSAELQVVLRTGDPQAGTREQGVRPLSRVSQHDVNTTVYVNALDFFDLSAFASQSTLNGGRGYVPIIGPVWQGLFGEIPVAGKLFSWTKNPQTVYSESLVLTNSFITPTAMGIALLYPTELTNERGEVVLYTDSIFKIQWEAVMEYKAGIRVR